jgi:hypothetical protein
MIIEKMNKERVVPFTFTQLQEYSMERDAPHRREEIKSRP